MPTVLTQTEYELLSDDPEIAVAEAIEIVLERVSERAALDPEDSELEYYRAWDEAASVLLGIIDQLRLNYKLGFDLENDQNLHKDIWIDKIKRSLLRYHAKVSLRRARNRSSGLMKTLDFSAFEIDNNFRNEIRKYTNKIRGILNQAEIGSNLRQLLINRLNAFEGDLDREKTRWESFFSFWRELTKAAGDGAENLEPAVKLAQRVGGALEKAAEQSEIEHRQQKALPPPSPDDDEIPF